MINACANVAVLAVQLTAVVRIKELVAIFAPVAKIVEKVIVLANKEKHENIF